MTHLVYLYGGPGSGKSTSAAFLFANLKMKGVNAELVREVAKEWAWEDKPIGVLDQMYIAAAQIQREAVLLGKVDMIVSDSPPLVAAFYAKRYGTPSTFASINKSVETYSDHLAGTNHTVQHLFLNRTKVYNPAGRYESEEDARLIDAEMVGFLQDEPVGCLYYIDSEPDDLALVAQSIIDLPK